MSSDCTMASANDPSFYIIEFRDEGIDGLKSIECVPKSWIDYNDTEECLTVRYMAPPYNDEDRKLIQDLIKLSADPPESWPQYFVDYRGGAETYIEAKKKLTVLNHQLYTTDSETHGLKKSEKITDQWKSRKIANLLSRDKNQSSSENESDQSSSNDEKKKKKRNTNLARKVIKENQEVKKARNQKTKSAPKQTTSASTHISSGPKAQKIIEGKSSALPEKHTSNYKNKESDSLTSNEPLTTNQPLMNNESKGIEFLYLAMKKMTIEVQNLIEEVQSLRLSIHRLMHREKVEEVTASIFFEKHSFQKITNKDEFAKFEANLKENAGFAKDFNDALEYLKVEDMKDTVRAILKKFFMKEFATQCTAVKKSGEKLILQTSKSYEIIQNFICHHYRGTNSRVVTEKAFEKAVGSCLAGSPDWNGGRKDR